jgi:hypothetical protein
LTPKKYSETCFEDESTITARVNPIGLRIINLFQFIAGIGIGNEKSETCGKRIYTCTSN